MPKTALTSYSWTFFGADDETRTRDLILTKAVLEGMKYDFLVFLRYW